MNRLGPEFFRQPTLQLAERLLGKIFVVDGGRDLPTLKGRIVETEAYLSGEDEASHAWRGMTRRNRAMFGPPGTLYIYFSYGCHYMANIVSEPEGSAGAVLLRAMEPVEGIAEMQRRRGTADLRALMSGPGKLTQALGIGPDLYADSLLEGKCWIEDAPYLALELVGTSTRIGISRSTELPWRKFVTDSPHVSKTKLSTRLKKGGAVLES